MSISLYLVVSSLHISIEPKIEWSANENKRQKKNVAKKM